MSSTTSQIDPEKLPSQWASYLEKVRQSYEPVGEGHVLNSGCSQKLAGEMWRFGSLVGVKDR